MMNRIVRILGLALTLCIGDSAVAQDYPNRPVKLIVPFAAGGPTDVTARAVAQRMSVLLDQQVIVDNRTGAGSTLGTEVVARSPADGYTLLFGTFSMAINATMYPRLPYDTINDFAPIGKIANTYLVLVTVPDFPARDFKEFRAALKANPGKYNYGTAGVGSGLHLASELLFSKAQLNGGTHVPYRGNAQIVPALLAGELSYGFLGMDSAVPYIKSGKLRAIAVSSPERDPSLPDVPTIVESGVPDFTAGVWFVLEAPKNTPPAIVRKLNATLNQALASPEFAEMSKKVAGLALLGGSTPESTDAFIREEITRWAPIIKATGAKPE